MLTHNPIHTYENTHDFQDVNIRPREIPLTLAESPAGSSVNSLTFRAAKGFTKSTVIEIF
jgi:hypothetical protein